MSCMGAFLGLRCTTRARPFQGAARARWLLLGGVSIGTTGVWLMHFIAMRGFTIPGETIDYNVPVTILSLLVVVGIVCVGLLIVGFGRDRYTSLILGGVITGTGVAVMHYLGMAAMRMPGRISYDPGLLIISVVIAIVAATAALWAALELQGIGTTLIASLIMGLVQTFAVILDVSLADLLARLGIVVTATTPFAEVLTVPLPRVGALLPFVLLVLILLFKPRGLLGTRDT